MTSINTLPRDRPGRAGYPLNAPPSATIIPPHPHAHCYHPASGVVPPMPHDAGTIFSQPGEDTRGLDLYHPASRWFLTGSISWRCRNSSDSCGARFALPSSFPLVFLIIQKKLGAETRPARPGKALLGATFWRGCLFPSRAPCSARRCWPFRAAASSGRDGEADFLRPAHG